MIICNFVSYWISTIQDQNSEQKVTYFDKVVKYNKDVNYVS